MWSGVIRHFWRNVGSEVSGERIDTECISTRVEVYERWFINQYKELAKYIWKDFFFYGATHRKIIESSDVNFHGFFFFRWA